MSENPYGVKPGQVWANKQWGRTATVAGVNGEYAYMLGAETGITTRRKLDSFSPTHDFRLVAEGKPLPAKTVRAAQTAPYMTIIPGRNPQTKAHMTLGEAKKAVLYRLHGDVLSVQCIVHQWSDTEGWERLWKIDAGTLRGDMPWNFT